MASLKTRRVYTLFLLRRFNLLSLFVLVYNGGFSQNPVKAFYRDSVNSYLNNRSVTENKIIPEEFKDAVQLALLYYPELSGTYIKFRVKKVMTPLSARSTIWSVFLKPSKRRYLITISNATKEKLSPILLKNLSFNSQTGVLGHELGHISEYNSKKGIFFIVLVFRHLSKKKMDTFEYNTDRRCIEHGLGYQLLNWSSEVRKKLSLSLWGGANNPDRERYMNPGTIIKVMETLPIYIKPVKE